MRASVLATVARDRFDYITAISDSWKAQMLLNVVKLRYADAPVFLDVASVITQYWLSRVQWQFRAPGFRISATSLLRSSSRNVTAAGTLSGERPTDHLLAA